MRHSIDFFFGHNYSPVAIYGLRIRKELPLSSRSLDRTNLASVVQRSNFSTDNAGFNWLSLRPCNCYTLLPYYLRVAHMSAPHLEKFTFSVAVPSRLCHIKQLNVDVLCLIFEAAIFDADAATDMPSLISHVSSHWRSVVCGSPYLWTKIRIQESLARPQDKFLASILRVTHFLDRSKQLPVDISVSLRTFHLAHSMSDPDHPFHFRTNSFRVVTKILSVVLGAHIRRIRRFILVADELPSVRDVQERLPLTPMPCLESWVTMVDDEEMGMVGGLDEQQANPTTGVDLYPRLQVLVLFGTCIPFGRFAPTNLTVLSLSPVPVSQRPGLSILRNVLVANAHSLKELALDLVEPEGYIAPFELPNLVSLTLGFLNPADAVPLVGAMRVPKLALLSITDLERDMHFPQAFDDAYEDTSFLLIAALVNYFPLANLRKLVISHLHFAPDRFDDVRHVEKIANAKDLDIKALPFNLFAAMTKLENLTLIYPTSTPLNCLNYIPLSEEHPKRPLPALRHLDIQAFSLPLIQSFLQCREEGINVYGKLDRMSFSMPRAWREEDIAGEGVLCRRRHVSYFDVDEFIELALRTGNTVPRDHQVWV
ncbi:hypothetical protein FPV67DRAFT_1462252 [Lyophyllum atratum]|nr:hypothetical protein FPV67DRAFT_1462252 [Lyophyllum atratum]